MNELAEVQMRYFRANEPIEAGFFDDAQMSVLVEDKFHAYPNDSMDIDDMCAEFGKLHIIPPAMYDGVADDDGTQAYIFSYPVMTFTFQFFGESYDESYAGGAEWDMREGMGVGRWFAEDPDDLVKTGLELLKVRKGNPTSSWYDFARWVVALSFSGGFDSYSGEYDCQSEYMGHVNLNVVEIKE